MNNPIEEFKTAMLENGITPPNRINDNGKINRFGKKKKCWYVYYSDNPPAGSFGDWSKNDKGINWCFKKSNEMTAKEKQAYQNQMIAIKKKQEKERNEEHRKAKIKANNDWNKASSAQSNHPYLIKKQVKSHGIRQQGTNLIIPIYTNNQLTSYQAISSKGFKQFLSGGEIKGGYFEIEGSNKDIILIGEGYSTVASCHEVMGYHAVVAFNAGNLKATAYAIKKKHPQSKIVLLADNDCWNRGWNIGVTKAKEASKAINAMMAIPKFKDTKTKPTDFNDLYCLDILMNTHNLSAQPDAQDKFEEIQSKTKILKIMK